MGVLCGLWILSYPKIKLSTQTKHEKLRYSMHIVFTHVLVDSGNSFYDWSTHAFMTCVYFQYTKHSQSQHPNVYHYWLKTV